MKNKIAHLLFAVLVCLSWPMLGFASDVGQVVNNILSPVSAFTAAFYKICYAMGILLIIGSGVQYRMYRKNPVQIRLGNVFFLLLVGIVVFCLPFVAKLSNSAKPIDESLVKQQQRTTVPGPKNQQIQRQEPVKPANNDWYDNYSH